MRFGIRVRRQQTVCGVPIFIRIEKAPSKHSISAELNDNGFAIVRCQTEEYRRVRCSSTGARDKPITFCCQPLRLTVISREFKPAVIITLGAIGFGCYAYARYWISLYINHSPSEVVRFRNWCRDCRSSG